MRKILSYGFLAPLLAAAFLVGCGPEYYPGDHQHPYPYPDGQYGGRYGEHGDVHGTVESVNPRERLIYLAEGRGERDRPPLALSYDDGTVVRYQGQTYRPEDLERGDRIRVHVDRDEEGRLFAEQIDVLYDVSQGGPPPGEQPPPGVQPPPGEPGGRPHDRGEDHADRLQGIIRSIDTDAQTLEIDRGGEPITVGYDSHTPVIFQGERYSPDNLERGDEVRIRVHDYEGRLFAQEIFVVRDRRSRG
ncbi:MAG TPA: DUF5666 domain-containing protein [Thermoanaerobaculia bacterium]|jgi:hypothetical protein